MSKILTSLLFLSLGLSADVALAQAKTGAKAKVAQAPTKAAKQVKQAPKAAADTTKKQAIAPAKSAKAKKTTAQARKAKACCVKQEQETIELENSNTNTVIEINKGEVYVNGDRISTIEDPKNERHKIIVKHADEQASQRKPLESTETKEDHLRRPMLGVYSDHNGDYDGAHVSSVIRNSPADDAGLLTGDVITKINGKAIKDAQELVDIVNDHNGGETINITYERQGREYHTEAALVETTTFRRHETYRYTVPDLHGERRFPTPFLHSYMFNNNDNTFEYAPQMGIEGQDAKSGRGVVVLKVKKNAPADIAGLREGDVIVRLDHHRTTSVDDIQDILNDTWPNQRITIEFKRDGVAMFAYMRFTRERVKRDL